MHPIRKPFSLDPLFPFELVYQKLRSSHTELPDHLHDLYELVYVHEGSGTLFVDQAFYEQKPGDLFLIPGNTIHHATPDAEDPIVSTAVFFSPALLDTERLQDGYSPLKCYERARKQRAYKLEAPLELVQFTEAALASISSELTDRRPGYRHAALLQLQQLLLRINRLHSGTMPDAERHRVGPLWLTDALRTIDDDPVRVGSLADLAKHAYVTPSHFSRTFRRMTGMNVIDYITAKRIVRAKELLLASEDNIELIAMACGFQGLPHFYRTFKRLTGMTPRAFRGS